MPRKEPTLKQKAFVKDLIKTRNITKSVKSVYDVKSDKNASALGNKTLQSPAVQNYMSKILDSVGLTDKELSGYLKSILLASVEEYSLKKITPSDGLRSLELIYKLKDRFPISRSEVTTKQDLTNKSKEELVAILDNAITEANKWKKLIQYNTKVVEAEVVE